MGDAKPEHSFEIEFYEEGGDQPVLRWMREELSTAKRRVLGLAMRHYLQVLGIGVCSSQFGKALGQGLYEFRLRYNLKELVERLNLPYKPTPEEDDEADVLLRVFFHPYGARVILLWPATTRARTRAASIRINRSSLPGSG